MEEVIDVVRRKVDVGRCVRSELPKAPAGYRNRQEDSEESKRRDVHGLGEKKRPIEEDASTC